MAGRAATAVKSKVNSKSAASSKTPTRVKPIVASASTASVVTAEPPPKPRRRTKPKPRTRIYWAVFNENLKRVAVFEFDQKVEAEKRASNLMTKSGEHHFIQKIKASVQAS
ncbi:MAG: hypothetical protein KDB22_07890 [Planctomycetales bacterium]|nr:hypothetical protein [Planctomycetales bacterium]